MTGFDRNPRQILAIRHYYNEWHTASTHTVRSGPNWRKETWLDLPVDREE
jgi:hypothetical protein